MKRDSDLTSTLLDSTEQKRGEEERREQTDTAWHGMARHDKIWLVFDLNNG